MAAAMEEGSFRLFILLRNGEQGYVKCPHERS